MGEIRDNSRETRERGGSVAGSARHEVTVSLEEKRKNELRIFEDLPCRETLSHPKFAPKESKITQKKLPRYGQSVSHTGEGKTQNTKHKILTLEP